MGELKLGKTVKPEVIDYHDYRSFLKEHFAYLEKAETGFSLRKLARDASVGVSGISMFLNGQRSLSRGTLEKLAPHLRLNEADLKHLELLRELSDGTTAAIREKALVLIQKGKAYRTRHPKEFETYKYLSSWYHVAIRELAALPGFQWNELWIQGRLRNYVSTEDIAQALKFLEENRFIERGTTGQPQKNLDCMGGVYKLALGSFHKQMFERVSDSIELAKSDERLILGHTVALPEAHLAEAKSILQEAFEKIEKLGDGAKQPDTVYHVALGIVPLTKKAGSNE